MRGLQVTLAELAQLLGAEVVGDKQCLIRGIAPLAQAQEGDLTFVTERKYAAQLAQSQATAVLVDHHLAVDRPAIRVADPWLGLITLLEHFFPPQRPPCGVDPRAVLGTGVSLGAQVSIGPYVVIGDDCRLGDRVIVYPGTYIGAACEIGAESVLHANVSLYPGMILGRGVIVHSGAVIGADGFGFYPMPDGSYRKIPQVGRVVIGDAVEIGANTCVDRAMLGDTIIEAGSKLDNLVQVGHNTIIEAHSMLAGQVGLSGSVRLGVRVRIAGQVGIADHVTVGEAAAIAAQAGVASDVEPGITVMGTPAVPITAFKRMHFYGLRLGELFQQVKRLEQRLALLEGREKQA
jgi:UDP-3-O-[3-hydroxymyristoyl] glucosamine N-acyltransferase